MSSKQLTAKVRLDTKQTERALKKLETRINKVNRAVNAQAMNANRLHLGFDKAANSANRMNKNVNKSAKSVSFLTKKVKLLANAYLGVMGAKAAINTSDMITSARNKLNNLPGGSEQQTQSTMDKTYAAAQRSRGDYGTMLTNVSKTMTLASDAFQGNVDNAIKFQEIMSKAYTVGGASAAEQASSMYQLVQALGSGVLQGDELRSVREGAAYAYKEIEKFAQGIYGAEENLKDLASEGKITSDIVVAAILSAEDKINQAFENTDMTFAQAGTNIKNTAIKAFEPVLTMMNEALNSAVGKGLISAITNTIIIAATAVQWLFNLIKSGYQFIVDNWTVVRAILIGIGSAIAIYMIPMVVAFISKIGTAIMGFASLIGQVIVGVQRFGMAAIASLFGVNLHLLIIALAIGLVIGLIFYLADSFVDACGLVVGTLFGVCGVIKAIASNIGIAFCNAWWGATDAFWTFIANCLDGLKDLEAPINAIAKALGMEGFTLSGLTASVRGKASAARGNMMEYVSVGDAWSNSYANGYSRGSGWGQGVVDMFGELKNKLGLNNDLFDPNSTNYAVGGNYNPEEALKGIKGDTGDIADSMDLTNEDLKYLRDVANMEWKKEFTTASIVVDMTNNNQISGDGDLDGIVTRLADKLYEELNVVANGVYA